MQLIKETFLNLAPPETRTKRTPIEGYSGLYLEQNKSGFTFQYSFKSPVTGKYRFMKLARFKYGDNINTDVIFPGRYLNVFDADEMAKYAMADLDAEFVNKVQKGDIVVAGKYFGCGSSREQAATCLKAAGVSTIIAKSFARIFYRNAINQGLAIMICPNIDEIVSTGDELL